jgi:monovalent cation/proton antiporter MnhG/PhaG subunit
VSLIENIIGAGMILFGLTLMIIGSIGLLRLPDFFARTHAASKVDTVGIVVAILGITFLGHDRIDAAKALVAAFLIMLTNPVAAHMLARAAYKTGLRPWKKGDSINRNPNDPTLS